VREIEIPLEVKKSTVVINYNTKMEYTPQENLLLSVFRDILNLRFTEEIREKEGGTYGVGVSASSSKFPKQEKTLMLNFDTDPAKANQLKAIVYQIIERIENNGPTAEDLDKAVKNLLKNREQSKLHNSYWMGALTTLYTYSYNSTLAENYENILNKITTADVQKFVKSFVSKADVVDVIFKPKAN
jgi:zinc protease